MDPRTLSAAEFALMLGTAANRGDLDGKTFHRLVRFASSEQLDAVMGDPAVRGPVLEEIFGRMAKRYRPDNAPRRDSAVHWRITREPDDENPDVYETWIAGDQCTTYSPPRHEPRVALTMNGEHFLLLVSGNRSPVAMFMTGKVKLDGDLGFAAALAKLFDIPKA